MTSFKRLAFLSLVGVCLTASACDFLEEAGDDDDDDATGTPTNTATPTPSVAPTPVTTIDGDIVTIDWGTIALDAGESPHFDFTAPAGTISIDFMALGAAGDAAKIFGFFSLSGPTGTVIDNSASAPARQAFAEGAMSFSLPSDDAAITQVSAGDYRFHVLAFDGADFVDSNPRVLVKIRTAPSGVPIGEIDVNVIVVEGVNGGLTAAQACATPPAAGPVYDALAYANALYDANLSLTIGAFNCYDLTSSSQFADIGGQDELSDLFETSGGVADERVNLFIVDSFSGDLGFAAGVAGSVPIPMQVNGTRRSGVAIQYSGNDVVMGETIAHEMGHSLGLYHTSEFNAATNGFDPISDSPTCPGLGSTYGGSGCTDDTNVMFPQLTGTMQGFTAGQGTVIAPVVHVRRQGVSAFAPSHAWTLSPGPHVWDGPPITCVDGIARRDW